VRATLRLMQSPLLIDISRLTNRTVRGRLPTGIDRVCLAYIEHFGKRAQAVLQWPGCRRVASHGNSQELFRVLRDPDTSSPRRLARSVTRAFFSRWPAQDADGRVYMNLGHSGLESPGLGRWLRRAGVRPVFMVHDLIPVTHPEYCRAGESARHVARMEQMLRMGAGILANSQATHDELQAFAKTHGLPVPPTVVAPLAAPELPLESVERAPLPQPYFVVLGTIEPRKNHLLLLNVWRRLVSELGEHTPHLVIIGQRGWECENVVDLLERCAPLRGVVHELGRCSDSELTQHLLHARALLFPSFAEGFGLPLVEALRLGTPAIASPLPVFQEIAGAVPDYVDALDGPAWAQAIRDYTAGEHPRRSGQLERLRSFEGPTWTDHFDRVDELLEMIS
jgi:glycosyltransferase involved in cell wall biosynthesis